MVFIGMIFQFNSDQGTGLIMLSDGEKKEFSTDEWVDESNLPKVGLQILYEISDNQVKIKVPSEEEKDRLRPGKKRKEEELTSFTSIEEFQSHYAKKGFDVIKNTDETLDDRLTMGRYSDEGVQSVSINFEGAKAEIRKKTIPLYSVDDHINYFKDTGYRLINDSDDNGSRKLTFRRYMMGEHSEIILTCSDDKITVIQMVDGKKIR
jgi:hypothetical protein